MQSEKRKMGGDSNWRAGRKFNTEEGRGTKTFYYICECVYIHIHTHKQFGLTMLSTRLIGYLTKSPVPGMGKLLSSR